jgi:hypothetical protein
MSRTKKEIDEEILGHELSLRKLYKERNVINGWLPYRHTEGSTFYLVRAFEEPFKVTITKTVPLGSGRCHEGEASSASGEKAAVRMMEGDEGAFRIYVDDMRFEWSDKVPGYLYDGDVVMWLTSK